MFIGAFVYLSVWLVCDCDNSKHNDLSEKYFVDRA